jgi:hypothetical protein
MCVNDYGIKRKLISMWNLQANTIVEAARTPNVGKFN